MTALRRTIYDGIPTQELARDPREPLHRPHKKAVSGSVGGNMLKPLFETPRRAIVTVLGVVALFGIGLESPAIFRAAERTGHAIESVIDNIQAHLRGTDPDKPVYPIDANSSVRNPDGTRRYTPAVIGSPR